MRSASQQSTKRHLPSPSIISLTTVCKLQTGSTALTHCQQHTDKNHGSAQHQQHLTSNPIPHTLQTYFRRKQRPSLHIKTRHSLQPSYRNISVSEYQYFVQGELKLWLISNRNKSFHLCCSNYIILNTRLSAEVCCVYMMFQQHLHLYPQIQL